ncbi:hypothetical protein [Oceanobacillus senegalensis]|uniref:hypothetical protein n=1 Tax=Oceanobacillus senegalensis TaxID=1936063 RepID=UPI000A306A6C|nr:hypothetical protein [Oceanobacillus senegalensis]
MSDSPITQQMVERYFELSNAKKEIETEMNQLKRIFHTYFDSEVGANAKGEWNNGKYKLLRQVRKSEKFNNQETIQRLEELSMTDLIKTEKKPDKEKIEAAINLGLIKEKDLEGCKITNYSKAISVKEV